MNSSGPYKPAIAVILSRFPYPLEKGDKLRAYYQLRDLSEHFDIHLFCTTDRAVSQEEKEQVMQYCTSLHIFRLCKVLMAVSLLSAVFGTRPFQVRYFYQPWIRRRIDAKLREIRPAHIFCQLIRVSDYVKHYHDCPKTIDYMDALSKGMERRIRHAGGFRKWIFRIESNRLMRYERRIFDYFEHHTIISAQDRNYILHPRKDTITLIPNGVDEKFFDVSEGRRDYTLVFTGNMGYPPNVEAAQYIRDRILPLLRQRKGIECLISGANPHPSLKSVPGFHVGGWVSDMRDSYRNARIFVAPMMIGTGLQNKLLEAMAMGLPCITTTLANNALTAIPGKQILIADDAESFARQILKLLDSPDLYEQIASGGKEFVKSKYKWSAANARLAMLLSQHQ